MLMPALAPALITIQTGVPWNKLLILDLASKFEAKRSLSVYVMIGANFVANHKI